VSPMRSRSPTLCVMMRRPGLEHRASTCGQRIWRRAISFRSRGALSAVAAQTQAVPVVAAARRESVSATTFDIPGTYTSWFVYSEMNARCRCFAELCSQLKIQNDLDIVSEVGSARGGDAVAQEIQLGDGKYALLQVEGQAVGGEQRAGVGPVLLSGFAEDPVII
jgi:hypothetical protein